MKHVGLAVETASLPGRSRLGGSAREHASDDKVGSRLPFELLVAMLLVTPAVCALAFDTLFPFPKDDLPNAARNLRAAIRIELVQGLVVVPTLLGCAWLLRFAPMRRPRAALLLFVISVGVMVDVVEALQILVLSPGALVGSATAFRWATESDYSAARLDDWAILITLVFAFGAWCVWEARRVEAVVAHEPRARRPG